MKFTELYSTHRCILLCNFSNNSPFIFVCQHHPKSILFHVWLYLNNGYGAVSLTGMLMQLLFCLWRTGAADDTTMVACSFTPCSQMFMTGSTYGDLRLWDLHMNQLHKEKNAHDLGVTCCTFAPNILSSGGQCKWEPLQWTLWFFS